MKQEVRDFVAEKTRGLLEAFSCCAELKAAAQAWLDAAGTEKEAEATKQYIAELEEDIMPIASLIAFAESQGGPQYFVLQKTNEVAAPAREIQAAGARYCDCPACAAAEAILEKKAEMLL